MTSTLLRGGVVYDGVLPHGRQADVWVQDGTIAAVGPDLPPEGARVLDVTGCWVLPGFVDAHSHADSAVITGHEMARRAMSGVTTEIVGQDGLGLPFTGTGEGDVVSDALAAITGPLPGAFDDVAAYLRAVDDGAFARTAVLAPHGTIRAAVTGRSLDTAPAPARDRMRGLVRQALEQGACGLSTGLSYPPALGADTDELVDVLREVPAGMPYVTHVRSYGADLADAVREACEIVARTPASLHLSHLHVSGPGREGRAGEVLDAVVAAAPDATWDSYPYLAGCTFLTAMLPTWAQELRAVDLVADAELSARVVADLDRHGPGPTVATGWENIVLAGLAAGPLATWDRRAVAAVADDIGASPGAVVLRAMEESAGRACVLVPQGHLDNVVHVASSSRHMVGSDGIFGAGVPHPRLAFTFLRFLAWAADGTVPFGVAEAVARMTSRPAARFGLPVGSLVPAAPADVVVVDPERLRPGPELEDGVPDAVVHAFVAGEATVHDGAWMGAQLTGLSLRRTWTW